MGMIADLDMLPDTLKAEAYSVVEHRKPLEGRGIWYRETTRGPILPAKGTRERERALHLYAYNDYNETFRSAVAGLQNRLISTPYEVSGDDPKRWQDLLMNADFGDWERWISKLAFAFLCYDGGAWCELIAPGDPLLPPVGAVVGLSVLDPLRCYPTGNPSYPVIYYDLYGKMHTQPISNTTGSQLNISIARIKTAVP